MSFCIRCGIEIDTDRSSCPLCENTLISEEERHKIPLNYFKTHPYPEDETSKQEKPVWTGRQKRFFAFELISLLMFIAAAVIFSINFLFPRQSDWVYVTLASLGLCWLAASIPLILMNHPLLIITGEILATLFFLGVMDLQDGQFNWFEKIALPNLILVSVLTITIVAISRKAKRKGINLAAFILFGISFLALGVNWIISVYLHHPKLVTWSVFVVIPATALGLFLLYVHYRLLKIVDINNHFKL